MRTTKLKTKITIVIILILSATIGLGTWVNSTLFMQEYRAALEDNMFMIGENLKQQLDRLLALGIKFDDIMGFDEQCREIVQKYKNVVFASVLDGQGTILFHSEPRPDSAVLAAPSVQTALQSGQNTVFPFTFEGDKYYGFLIPLSTDQAGLLGAVLLWVPRNIVTQKTSLFLFYSVLLAGASFVISFFLINYILTAWVTLPLSQLERAVKSLRLKGEPFPKVAVKSRDEIGHLIFSFNQMAKELKATTVSKDFMDRVISSMTDALLVLDAELRIRTLNKAGEKMLQYKESELLGQPVDVLFYTPEASPFRSGELATLLTEGGATNLEMALKRKDGGSTPVLLSYSLLKTADGQGIEHLVCTAKDITERKKAEQVLMEQTQKLLRSNEELKEFAFIESHDLQEPLRKIIFFGERLEEKYRTQLDEQGLDYLSRMQRATKRMLNLINGLLTYSRISTQGQPFKLVDLNQVAREVLSDLEMRILQTNARIEVGELGRIEAQPVQMYQLFQNLISNGIKFHRPGVAPQIKISARKVYQESTWSDQSLEYVELTVADNGIGIEPQYFDRIFKVFQRLHGRNQYEGTGIGLAVCHKIVHQHKGSIKVESSLGAGAKFIVCLPVQQEQRGGTENE
ncbi:MAG: PAS domain S-box protein [Firmicutes bacterium]|nr:PAS domain S-box protein [Bacillota bacterium]